MGDLLASSLSTGRSQVPTLPPPHTLLPPHMPVGASLPLWVPPHPQPHVPLLGAGARKLRGPAPSPGAPSVARKEEAPRATRLQPPLSPCADTGDTRPRRGAIRETRESRSREIRTWQFGRCLAGSHREGAPPRFTPGGRPETGTGGRLEHLEPRRRHHESPKALPKEPPCGAVPQKPAPNHPPAAARGHRNATRRVPGGPGTQPPPLTGPKTG